MNCVWTIGYGSILARHPRPHTFGMCMGALIVKRGGSCGSILARHPPNARAHRLITSSTVTLQLRQTVCCQRQVAQTKQLTIAPQCSSDECGTAARGALAPCMRCGSVQLSCQEARQPALINTTRQQAL